MDQFLNNIWSENNYPAKTRLLKLAKEANPEVKPKDIDKFLNDQISYQLLKETKNLTSHLGHKKRKEMGKVEKSFFCSNFLSINSKLFLFLF